MLRPFLGPRGSNSECLKQVRAVQRKDRNRQEVLLHGPSQGPHPSTKATRGMREHWGVGWNQ
eukprot:2637993-Alexandrium_andersonii.AAC.1